MKEILVTVIEHHNYLKQAEDLLTPEQMDEIADILAANPEAGAIMSGTSGCRKMRYAGTRHKGKSGGMRIIHLFVVAKQKVHLLDIYAKGEKQNLTKADRNELAKLAEILKKEKP